MRVLIVDDDRDILRLISLAFRKRGHEVEEMEHGLGVIGRLAGWEHPPPDVCVLDNYLPEISGVAILNLAARTRVASSTPIVIYSSDVNVGALVDASAHEHAHFALKGHILDLVTFVESLMPRDETDTR